MELFYIFSQILRNNAASLAADSARSPVLFKRESVISDNTVLSYILQHSQNFTDIKGCGNVIHYAVGNIIQLRCTGSFGFFRDRHNDIPLTLRTLKIVSNITDTAISCSLQAIQRLHTGMSYRCIICTFRSGKVDTVLCGSYHTDLIVVQIMDFALCDVYIHTPQSIDYFDQTVKSYRNIICNIHVQILIQHHNCLFRSALCIRRITFIIIIISKVQIRITENRDKLYVSCVLIDRCDNDRITSCSFAKRAFPGIHTKQSYVSISLHNFIIFHIFVHLHDNAAFVDLNSVYTLCFQNSIEKTKHHYEQNNFGRKQHYPLTSLCRLFLGRHLFTRRSPPSRSFRQPSFFLISVIGRSSRRRPFRHGAPGRRITGGSPSCR